ncbi:retrovirus-related pol polyprotein from transposon TNT 1-94 [Tanacetum coccineum]
MMKFCTQLPELKANQDSFLAFASFMGFTIYQMDVKSEFLYGNITEEVYVKQPPGFEDPVIHNKILQRSKAPLWLTSSPKSMSVYGEDLKILCKGIKMSSLGELTFFLGLKVKQNYCWSMYWMFNVFFFLLQDQKNNVMLFVCVQGLSHSKEAFSDSDYAGDNHDRRSTSGGVNILRRRLFSWQCKKQTIVAIYIYRPGNMYQLAKVVVLRLKVLLRQIDPDLIGLWLQQFWATASLGVINEVPHIRAMVAGKRVLISEETIRADLLFDDADGVDCFPKQVIWDSLRDIGYEGNLAQLTFSKPLFSPQWKYLVHVLLHCLSAKSTSWEEFGTNIASALVGLATNQKFNFSLMIMNGMLGHIANVTLPSKVFTFMRKHSPKFSCRITPLTPPMLEVVTALAAEEAQSESPHLRAASSRGSLKDPYSRYAKHSRSEAKGAADIPKIANDYTPNRCVSIIGGDEGLLDLYALNREVRRLKKQTISQAKQIHKLKVKLKKLEQKKKVSSIKLGRNKDEGNLSEEHHDQDDHTAFVHEGFDATKAAVTPDLERKSDESEELERKSDESEQVAIEEEKDASDVKSGDTEELDLEEIQSTARQSVVIPNHVHSINQPPKLINKWTKDHSIDNVIGDPSRPVSTRQQPQDEALFGYFDAFFSFVEPKSYKDALTESCWIEAMQEELNELECLEVWELAPCPVRVMVITLKWIYKVKLDELGGVLKNKARLVARGYHQEEGIDFEESFAPVA